MIADITIEEMLTILINFGHASRVETGVMFQWAKEEIYKRVQMHYNPKEASLFIKDEDIPKIMNTFHHYGCLDSDMRSILNQ